MSVIAVQFTAITSVVCRIRLCLSLINQMPMIPVKDDSSSVTPQVFTLFNSDNSYERSIAFALRLQQERGTVYEQVKLAYQLAFGRNPDDQEFEVSLAHVKSKVAYHQKHQPEVKEYPTILDRSLVEEMSGVSFDYKKGWMFMKTL